MAQEHLPVWRSSRRHSIVGLVHAMLQMRLADSPMQAVQAQTKMQAQAKQGAASQRVSEGKGSPEDSVKQT